MPTEIKLQRCVNIFLAQGPKKTRLCLDSMILKIFSSLNSSTILSFVGETANIRKNDYFFFSSEEDGEIQGRMRMWEEDEHSFRTCTEKTVGKDLESGQQ